MKERTFDFRGFAATTDFEGQDWARLFSTLERVQDEFLKDEGKFRSDGYKWPRDPLHSWSRAWEYPYVYYHIEGMQGAGSSERLRILDFGSGVTFFPFSVARLGHDVTCADIDPICELDIPEAGNLVDATPGTVSFALIENGRIPVESGTQDVVYCISVLEHISEFSSAVDEIARVLKPDGVLIATVDVDLQGNSEMGVQAFEHFQAKLSEHFAPRLTERPVHPRGLLTTKNSPYPLPQWSLVMAAKQFLKGLLHGRLIFLRPKEWLYLSVYSSVVVKLS